tara:strand:- start:21 stop:401 length:381 start_codon:yes stop_codon:yes gene_type:complete
MRAKEFITEDNGPGKLTKRQRYATRGAHKFQDVDGRDRVYELNRVMMALAQANGESGERIDLDSESWVGTSNLAFPYTEVEANMLKAAYKAVGSEWEDLNSGDMKSVELPTVNTESPIEGFKGYPR